MIPVACSRYLYEAANITHHYLSRIPTRHCLCSSRGFALSLLEDDLNNDAIEWAQNREEVVIGGNISTPIRLNGHVLTAIFVPIPCSLSIKIFEETYYFDPDLSDSGHKFSLYLPLFYYLGTIIAFIEGLQKFDGKSIPLTFFYLDLRPSPRDSSGGDGPSIQGLHNAVSNHLEDRFLLKSGFPARLTFVTKGRINIENYSSYIVNNQVRVATLGNFELITLYTCKRGELCRLLASKLEVFTILE